MTENSIITYPNIKQSWGIVGISILSMILFSPIHLFLSPAFGKELSFLIYYLFSVGGAFYFVHLKRKKLNGESEYNFGNSSGRIILLIFIAVIALQIGIVTPVIDLIPMPESIEKLFNEFSKQSSPYSFFAIVIAAPVFEELIFRGIVLDGLLKNYSPIKAILVSSALFGFVHLNPWQFVPAFLIGIFSGWVYYKTRQLTLSILIHLVNNGMAFGVSFFIEPEAMEQSLTEMYGGSINVILICLGATGVAACCIYLLTLEIKANYGVPQE